MPWLLVSSLSLFPLSCSSYFILSLIPHMHKAWRLGWTATAHTEGTNRQNSFPVHMCISLQLLLCKQNKELQRAMFRVGYVYSISKVFFYMSYHPIISLAFCGACSNGLVSWTLHLLNSFLRTSNTEDTHCLETWKTSRLVSSSAFKQTSSYIQIYDLSGQCRHPKNFLFTCKVKHSLTLTQKIFCCRFFFLCCSCVTSLPPWGTVSN